MNITNKPIGAIIAGGLLLLLMPSSLFAQKLVLDSVRVIRHTTYDYPRQPANAPKYVSVFKESIFDSARVLIQQSRASFIPSDTGLVKSSDYYFKYNPQTKLGEYYTEKFPTPKNPKITYSKQPTKFRSHNHEEQVWVEQYNEKGNLIVKSSYAYNAQNQRVGAETQDFQNKSNHIEIIARNAAGKMTSWQSYDEQNGSRTQVRDMRWTYLNDTLLLTNTGYVYNNYTETVNKYDKNNLLSKTTAQTGYRQENGKTTLENTILTEYKNGRPVEMSTTLKGQKISTAEISYTPTETITTTTTKVDKKKVVTTKIVKTIYQQDKLLERTETEQGKPLGSLQNVYTDGHLSQSTEIEHKQNGDVWKTVTEYDHKGNPTRKIFYIQNQPRQEDVYIYERF